MLMQIRERASGIIAYIIIGLIAIPFAFWGIHEYLGGPDDQKVAVVNDEEIVKRAFDAQVQDQRRYLKSILGSSFDSVYSDESKLKQSVLDSLIQNALLSDEINDAGYRISDNKLTERIQAVPQFQNAGRFDSARYEQLLTSQRRSPVEFENQLRLEEAINQYQGSAVYSSFLPSEDKKKYSALKQQKRNFDYFLINADENSVEVTDKEIDDYYQSNKQSFKTLQRVKLEYLEVKQKDIGDALTFTEDEIQSSYDDDPGRYQTPELRKASHILLKLEENASEDQVALALSNMKTAADRIKNGEDFANLAEEISEDKFSADKGGSLGYITRTDFDNPVFVQTLFSMQKGDVSAPIKTSLGVQLIKLEDITSPKTKALEQVRTQIENELRADASDKEYIEIAERLSNLSYVNEDNLDSAADELGMKVQTSDWISGAELEGIASYPSVVSAAFSDEVLNKGVNSALLEVADGYSIVVRVAEHEPSEIQPLGVVKDDIIRTVKTIKARDQLISKAKNVIEKLNDNSSNIDNVVKQFDVSLESAGALLRDDDSVPDGIVDHVFSLSTSSSYPLFDGVELDNGQFAVIRLNEVLSVADSDVNIETAEWISVQGRYGRREMQAMLNALRETGDVTVFPENI
ncbi:MAG: SurA N-terminal domain-containing protein [Gammaproteobacteria bacterium]|nr:SurA N-terminal domain-containing protein [Gammaproteobacteria bacterium]